MNESELERQGSFISLRMNGHFVIHSLSNAESCVQIQEHTYLFLICT